MILDPFTKGLPASFWTRLTRYFYKSTNQESAGCVVVNNKNQFLLIRRGAIYNDWTFPKGKVENNRKPELEAVRETYEEVRLNVKILAKLPSSFYSFYVDKKRIKINGN